MPSGRLMKHLFLPLLGFGVIATATAASAQTAPPGFVSAIGDNTNVVFVENHIVIDRPANEIFDFVSTPGNVYKWFTKSSDAKPFISGALDHPNRVGDQVFENIDFPDGRKLRLVQTTVVCIPGFEWVVTGQPVGSDGKPLPQVLSLAVWTVQYSSRWQEYVQQVLLPCRVGRKRDRVALEEWRLGPSGEPSHAGTDQEIP